MSEFRSGLAIGVLVIAVIGLVIALIASLSSDSDSSGAGATAPPCNDSEALRAVRNSPLPAELARDLNLSEDEVINDGSVVQGYHVSDVFCEDLTGDGADEMTALLSYATSLCSATPVAIFEAENGSWGLRYDQDEPLGAAALGGESPIQVEDNGLAIYTPVYDFDDPCGGPHAFRTVDVTWDGDQFVAEEGPEEPAD